MHPNESISININCYNLHTKNNQGCINGGAAAPGPTIVDNGKFTHCTVKQLKLQLIMI